MKKKPIQGLALILLASLSACDSADLPIQHADNYGYMSFSVQTEQLSTRTNPYESYDPAKHPSNMGVFGYYDITHDGSSTPTGDLTAANTIFDNTLVSYQSDKKNWDPSEARQWDAYTGKKSFDFFANMPRSEDTKITHDEGSDEYTLSFPFYIPRSGEGTSAKPAPLMYDVTKAPLICAMPEHKTGTTASGNQTTLDRTIKFQFDQTLTGYQLLFKLDPKMGAIRQFRIKKVTLTGDLATSGTVSRTYKWDGSNWTAGERIWTDLNRVKFDASSPFEIASQATSSLVVTSSDYSQWGATFYTIPDSKFNPTITVTYDVELTAEDGSTVVTRKDITSDITFNKTNFDKLTTGGMALVNSIRILIQPRYLYVLGDDDAYTGHLLVE